MGVIYLDSCILIYAVEERGERGDRIRDALASTTESIAVSPLVLHECLVGPLRDANYELRDRHLAVYEQLHQIELDTGVFIRAAELRAATAMRGPDSIHVAAAQRARCDALWTNDHRLARAAHGLSVNVLS